MGVMLQLGREGEWDLTAVLARHPISPSPHFGQVLGCSLGAPQGHEVEMPVSGSRDAPGLLCPPSYLELLLCWLLVRHRVRDAGISLLAVLEGS